jgi:hypothetical protein
VAPSGRELIDHARGRHDDLSNVVAGAAEMCSLARVTPMAQFGRYGSQFEWEKKQRASRFDGPIEEGELKGGFATSSKLGGLKGPGDDDTTT